MKILITDDEKPVRSAIKLLVKWQEFGVTDIFEAEDGDEAIRIINSERPELVLTDIMMPVSTGLHLMEWIYQNVAQCKVIAISGYADYEYVRQIFVQGGIDYILKPIQPDRLLSAVQKAISQIEVEKLNAASFPEEKPEADQNPNSVFYQIKFYINENYRENLTLSSISTHFFLSESYVSRKFRQLFHVTIIQYIKSVRMNHAKRYLIRTHMPISEIAEKVGYKDEKYFSRIFRETENQSPYTYRRIHSSPEQRNE